MGSVTYGQGVTLQKLESVRDPILQLVIEPGKDQEQGQLNTYVSAMQQAQVQFTSSSTNMPSQISNLFSSLSQLSHQSHECLPAAAGVLTAAGNLATVFNNTSASLTQQRASADLNVTQTVPTGQSADRTDCRLEHPDQPAPRPGAGCQFV